MNKQTADDYCNSVIKNHMKAIGKIPVELIVRGAIISAFNAGLAACLKIEGLVRKSLPEQPKPETPQVYDYE